MSCVLKTCSHANVPCVLTCSRTSVSCLLMCLRANVPCMLTCSRANVPCALTCSHANVLCVLLCSHVYMPCVLMYSRIIVDGESTRSRSNIFWVSCLKRLALPCDHVPTCFVFSVSSFDATFFSFNAIAVEVVHKV